ncbi:peptide MFS transporter [Sphingomonas endophytica]|uniref:Amino acid transporter n=1 Tax=Sphingomonas endophytica TaxID=869719 RepID=A0A147I0X2_9SPHN|nr:oligopeptide:H+ symporter [Sphingomonas endophytica]KTT71100.1 amino acid transporter [Sphingomonas endophytica]
MVDTPTADSPREPDISHVNPTKEATWFGHPRQLARLFTTEMWERFGFYGMRALLTLYLTQHFLFGDRAATGLYGGYTALVYLTPLIGGYLADQYLGSKRAVKFGAVLMAIGYFTLCFGGETARPFATIDGQRYEVAIEKNAAGAETRYVVDGAQRLAIKGNDDGTVALLNAGGQPERVIAEGGFQSDGERSAFHVTLMLLALCMVSVGNGFFKPNISTMVGELYPAGDRRRDTGFTIFYMGINLGSLLSQLLCPLLATMVGWWAGFGLAALGMLISWSLIQFDGGRLSGYGEPPVQPGQKDRAMGIYAAALIGVPLFYLLFTNLMNAPEPVAGAGIVGYVLALPLMGKLLFGTFLIAVPGILIWSYAKGSRVEFQMMLAAMTLIVFNVVFWTLFEQAGSSLTLYADRNTDLSVFGLFSLSAGQTQFFNAFFIVVFAPIMAAMWTKLAAQRREPSIPVKFGIALILVGLGFLFLVWGGRFASPDFKVAIWWLAGLYLIHSVAELCISPVGLSMVTKLSIARVVGLMMGVWFLSVSVAQYVAGVVAQVASVETVGGQVTNLKVSLDTYNGVFWTIGLVAAGVGGLLLLLSPIIRKWMHGVQ